MIKLGVSPYIGTIDIDAAKFKLATKLAIAQVAA